MTLLTTLCPGADFYDPAALRTEMVEDEGCELDLYWDSRGNPSIGIGHNLAGGISQAAADFLFAEDIATAATLLDANAAWWRELPPAQARVMLNLCFNLGWGKLRGFPRFLAAMQARQWETAAAELRDSDWWHEVGERGPRMVARLLVVEAPAAA